MSPAAADAGTSPDATLPVAVIGAGPVGMALALAVSRCGRRVVLIDVRPAAVRAGDPRVLALSAGSRQLLERLAAWPAQATPIGEVHISQQGGFGRTLLRADERDLPALGYVVAYPELCNSLEDAVRAAAIESRWGCRVGDIRRDAEALTLATSDGELRAALVVHAEGSSDADCEIFDYRQDALVCVAQPDAPHGGRAWERFSPKGPLALLPFGRNFAVIFVCPRDEAAALAGLGDDAFCAVLAERMGGRVHLRPISARTRVPLALRRRKTTVGDRELWIGNAAQTLHPASGQGLNLGLRDAWELAETLAATEPSASHAAALAAFARRRRFDRLGSIAFTDGIVRIFANDLPLLGVARGLGLTALDLLPPLRRGLVSRLIFGRRS